MVPTILLSRESFRQQEAIATFQWPAMFPDMNPMRHVWNFISSKVNQRNPECQNIAELTNAIPEEWRRFPQERPRRLVLRMNRRVWELWRKRGGYLSLELELWCLTISVISWQLFVIRVGLTASSTKLPLAIKLVNKSVE